MVQHPASTNNQKAPFVTATGSKRATSCELFSAVPRREQVILVLPNLVLTLLYSHVLLDCSRDRGLSPPQTRYLLQYTGQRGGNQWDNGTMRARSRCPFQPRRHPPPYHVPACSPYKLDIQPQFETREEPFSLSSSHQPRSQLGSQRVPTTAGPVTTVRPERPFLAQHAVSCMVRATLAMERSQSEPREATISTSVGVTAILSLNATSFANLTCF